MGRPARGRLLIQGFLPGGEAQIQPQQSGTVTPQFRVNANLVSLHVSVTDNLYRPVAGLTRDDFEVFEDKVAQAISFFSLEDSPLAVGLVLDSSGSMERDIKMERARAAALHFVRTSHPDDQVFLVDFDSRAIVTLDFSSNLDALAAALAQSKAGGRTALYDAVYLALEKLNSLRTERRRVILLITDGEDTASRHSLKEVDQLAREADVQLYAVGICGMDVTPTARGAITRLAEMTGGRAFFTFDTREMVPICHGIAIELHRQYSLGYQPTNLVADGKWRRLDVKVKRREGLPRLVVRSRRGYYARGAGSL